MIIHIVAWAFRDDVSAAELTAVNDGLGRGREIPPARSFALSENRSPVRADGFTHAYLATFADRDALAAFQRDERHAPLGTRLVATTSQLMVLDLECAPADAPRERWHGLRHIVTWSFKPDTPEEEKVAVVVGLARQREVRPARSFAVGANLGLSARSLGRTHLHVGTFGDFAGLEEFRSDTLVHAPAGRRMQASAEHVTVLDVID